MNYFEGNLTRQFLKNMDDKTLQLLNLSLYFFLTMETRLPILLIFYKHQSTPWKKYTTRILRKLSTIFYYKDSYIKVLCSNKQLTNTSHCEQIIPIPNQRIKVPFLRRPLCNSINNRTCGHLLTKRGGEGAENQQPILPSISGCPKNRSGSSFISSNQSKSL